MIKAFLGNGNYVGNSIRGSVKNVMSNSGFGNLIWTVTDVNGNQVKFHLNQKHLYKSSGFNRTAGGVKKTVLKHINNGYFNDADLKWLKAKGIEVEGEAFVSDLDELLVA